MDGFKSFETGLPSLDDVQARIDSQQEVLSSVVGDVFAPLDSAMNYQQGIMDKLNGRIKRQINGRLNAQHEMMQGVIGGIENAVSTRIGSVQHQLATIEGGMAASGAAGQGGPPGGPRITGYLPPPPHNALPPPPPPIGPPRLPYVPPHGPPPIVPPIVPPPPPYLPPRLPGPHQPGEVWQLFVNCQTRDTAAFVVDPTTGTNSAAIGSGYQGPVGPQFFALAEAINWLGNPANRHGVEQPVCLPNRRPGPRSGRRVGPQSYLPPPSQGATALAPPSRQGVYYSAWVCCSTGKYQIVQSAEQTVPYQPALDGCTQASPFFGDALEASQWVKSNLGPWMQANCPATTPAIPPIGPPIPPVTPPTVPPVGPPNTSGYAVYYNCGVCLTKTSLVVTDENGNPPPTLGVGEPSDLFHLATEVPFSTDYNAVENANVSQSGIILANHCPNCPNYPPIGIPPPIGTPPPIDGFPPPEPCPPCQPCPTADGSPTPCPCPDWDDLLHKLCKCLQSMSVNAPVDLDQPLAFIFGEQGQAWRDAAIQWHGEGLQTIVDSPSVGWLVANRPSGRSMKYNG